MKKFIILLIIVISLSGCYMTFRTPQDRRGLRPLWYSPRTHHGPFYKQPRPNQMKPHFNNEGRY